MNTPSDTNGLRTESHPGPARECHMSFIKRYPLPTVLVMVGLSVFITFVVLSMATLPPQLRG